MMRMIPLVTAVLLAAAPAWAEIEIQNVQTPAGHSAWLVEERSIPMVAIDVIFAGGASIEPLEQSGVVSLMTSLLNEGAGDLDAQGFAAALESTAGSISFEAGRDSVSVSIRALSENRDAVVDLAILALTQPRFEEAAVARTRNQQVASLERELQTPAAQAGAAWRAAGYGDHPYSTNTDGSPETIAALTRDQIVAAHGIAFARNRAHIGAAGDISADELAALVDRLLAGLPESTVPLPDYRPYQAEPGVTVIPFDGPQSAIQFGYAGLHVDDPDYMAAMIVNEYFGGGRFGTQLMNALREESGLTYGVGMSLSSGRFGDAYVGGFSTDNATAGQALQVLREQFALLAENGLTQADMDRVVTYLTGAYPLRFDGNADIAGIMASMQFQDFDIDYVNVRNDRMRAVTLEQVNAMAARLARPDDLVITIAGRPQGLE